MNEATYQMAMRRFRAMDHDGGSDGPPIEQVDPKDRQEAICVVKRLYPDNWVEEARRYCLIK